MRWPWQQESKLETRQGESSYTDAIINALLSRAQGKTLAVPSATAALEACTGTVGRGFMAGEVSGRPAVMDAVTPDCLEIIGRGLIRYGEVVFLIDTTAGRLQLLPAETWDVEGGPMPDSWWYRVTLGGPSNTFTYPVVPAASVLHFKYAIDSARPWRGNGPLTVASLAGRLSAETVNVLANESSGPVGRLLGIAKDGADSTVANLKKDIANAKGRVALLENGDWDNVGTASVNLKAERFGAEPPQSLVNLLERASQEIYAACGFSRALWGDGNAAAARSPSEKHGWRVFGGMMGPVQ